MKKLFRQIDKCGCQKYFILKKGKNGQRLMEERKCCKKHWKVFLNAIKYRHGACVNCGVPIHSLEESGKHWNKKLREDKQDGGNQSVRKEIG